MYTPSVRGAVYRVSVACVYLTQSYSCPDRGEKPYVRNITLSNWKKDALAWCVSVLNVLRARLEIMNDADVYLSGLCVWKIPVILSTGSEIIMRG